MKFVVVLVAAGTVAFLGAVICIIASVYPRKIVAPGVDNGTLAPERFDALAPGAVAHAGPLGALQGGGGSFDGGNSLGGIGFDVPTLNELGTGDVAGVGSAKTFSFNRLICTPVPVGECNHKIFRQQQQPQADDPWAVDEESVNLRTTAKDLRQVVGQQNEQILMDKQTIRELTGKLNECESDLEDDKNVPERSVGPWSSNRRFMAGDDVSSSAAAQLQTARAVEELERAIMDLKDRIEKLEAEIGPAALNLTDTSASTTSSSGASNTGSSSNSGGNSNSGSVTVSRTTAPPAAPGASGPGAPGFGGRRPAARPAPQGGSSGRGGKGPWKVGDLEGELERKIKLLEKERQTMRKESQGHRDNIDKGLETVDHRLAELEHSESLSAAGG